MAIYLDNAATTRIEEECIEEIEFIYRSKYGNPSSLHSMGLDAEKIVKLSKDKIGKIINSKSSNIILTSGGTESNNTGLWQVKRFKNKNKILTTKLEHPSVLNYCEFLKEHENIQYKYYDINKKGQIIIDKLINKIDVDTVLVTIPFVNSETGITQDIKKISDEIKRIDKNILIHVDGVQAFGKIKLDVKNLDVDTVAFSSHKIHGPKGIGGIYIKEPNKFIPLIVGGGQQKNLRAGTENVASISAFGKTCEIARKNIDTEYNRILDINKYLRNKLKESIDDIKINSEEKFSSPYILNFSIKDIKSEILIHYLEMDNIYISSGSACSSNYDRISTTYEVLKMDSRYVEGAVRISFGRFNNISEIDILIEKMSKYVKKIRELTRGK